MTSFKSTKDAQLKVADNGDLQDAKYHQHDASVIMSTLVGRQQISTKSKSVFSANDILREGFMLKRGSWFKSWKKRYFMLRRDVKELCIYLNDDKESLTMIGSVSLNETTSVRTVPIEGSDSNDGHSAFIHIQNGTNYGNRYEILLRAEDELLHDLWFADINKLCCFDAKEETQDLSIWDKTFHKTKYLECLSIKSDKLSRALNAQDLLKNFDHIVNEETKIDLNNLVISSQQDEEVEEVNENTKEEIDEDSDQDSINLEFSKLRDAVGGDNNSYKKNLKKTKPKKKKQVVFEDPPYKESHINRFIFPTRSSDSHFEIGGLQFSLKVNYCVNNTDKIFIVLSASEIIGDIINNWVELSRTEIQEADASAESLTLMESAYIYFNLLQPPVADLEVFSNYQYFKINVYRVKNDSDDKNDNAPISRCIISRKELNIGCNFLVKMKVLDEDQYKSLDAFDYIPAAHLHHPKVTIGIVGVSSLGLYQLRKNLQFQTNSYKTHEKNKHIPYAEMSYCFNGSNSKLLCIEQIFASRYSLSVTEAFQLLIKSEKKQHVKIELQKIREKFNEIRQSVIGYGTQFVAPELVEDLLSGNISGAEGSMYNAMSMADALLKSVNSFETIFDDIKQTSKMVLAHTRSRLVYDPNCCDNDFPHSIPIEHGGLLLRRSVWKKDPAWQYSAMNLTIQILSGARLKHTGVRDDCDGELFSSPTITFGCPAAHQLKFSDGGLRKIFSVVKDPANRLDWIRLIQYSGANIRVLKKKIKSDNIAAQHLLGLMPKKDRNESKLVEDQTKIREKLHSISKRLDCVCSQILGLAVTVVRTICHLATVHKRSGKVYDALVRSLKIGFLVYTQCYLSTQGPELGMIEDMDVAILWLNSVKVRLVKEISNRSSVAKSHMSTSKNSSFGASDGVYIRRSIDGLIVVDIEITPEEAETIQMAVTELKDYEKEGNTVECIYLPGEPVPEVLSVTGFVGSLFTQGVNEMQTFANMSRSSECQRQIDINIESFSALKFHLSEYRMVTKFHLTQKMKRGTLQFIDECRDDECRESSLATKSKASEGTYLGYSFSHVSDQTVNSPPINNYKLLGKRRVAPNLLYFDQMIVEARDAIEKAATRPFEKNVNVLLKTGKLCREIAGVICILCKSGKDRTSMGVTFDQARYLADEEGLFQPFEACQIMRKHGVRRMNVYANTGQSKYAFNGIQSQMLPKCFRPPVGTHAGNVKS